jgi:hypothetical protein
MLRRAFQCLTRLANPPVFVITIADGEARFTKGRATPSSVRDCTSVATDFGIERGYIDGVRTLHGIALRFSPDICTASHQRFRNVLATHLLDRH